MTTINNNCHLLSYYPWPGKKLARCRCRCLLATLMQTRLMEIDTKGGGRERESESFSSTFPSNKAINAGTTTESQLLNCPLIHMWHINIVWASYIVSYVLQIPAKCLCFLPPYLLWSFFNNCFNGPAALAAAAPGQQWITMECRNACKFLFQA